MNFYVTGGSLQSDAPSYVERRADKDLLQGLLEGEFCYVLTARQMGKSSLMVRTATRLRAAGMKVAALDLTAVGGQNVTPDQWYYGLLDMLGQELDLEDELEALWQSNSHLGPLHRLMKALRHIVVQAAESELSKQFSSDDNGTLQPGPKPTSVRLVIFVDEIDFVRSLPFPTDEFFSAIRECYNHRGLDKVYCALTFCLLGVASPSDLIRDTRTTPFNIGRRIELNDFTPEEAAPLARGLQMDQSAISVCEATELLSRILYWTDGHPYLTQKLCRVTAEALQGKGSSAGITKTRGAALADELCAGLFFSHRARERDDNLVFVRERLLRNDADRADLLDFYLRVWRGRQVVDDELDPLVSLLRLSGIVRVAEGRLLERNRIYKRVFDAEWVRANLPEAELRRQRQAFRRGVGRAMAISSLVITAVAITGVLAFRAVKASNRKQQIALAHAYFVQAQMLRNSGRAGQRVDSLKAIERARGEAARESDLRDEAIASMSLIDLERNPDITQLLPGFTACALSANATHLAQADASGRIDIVDLRTGRIVSTRPPAGALANVVLSRNGRFLAVQEEEDGGNQLAVWDCQLSKPVLLVTNSIAANAVDFSADSSKLAVGLREGVIWVFGLSDGKRIATLSEQAHIEEPRQFTTLRFDPTGSRLAEVSRNSNHAVVYDLYSQTTVSLPQRSSGVAVAWHPTGQQLAIAAEHDDIYLWDLDPLKRRELPQAHAAVIRGIAFSPKGELLASLGDDMTLRLWTLATFRQVTAEFEGLTKGRLEFSDEGDTLIHTAFGGVVQRWRVYYSPEYTVFRPSRVPSPVTSFGFGGDGRLLVTSTELGVTLWDSATGTEAASIPAKTARTAFLDLVHGDLIATTASGAYRWPRLNHSDGSLGVVNLGQPECLSLPYGLNSASFSEGTRSMAVLHDDHVHLTALGAPFADRVLPCRGNFQSLALNRTADWLALFSEKGQELQLWDIDSTRSTLRKAFVGMRAYSFSPDGRWIATHLDKRVRFLELETWRQADLEISASRPSGQGGPFALAKLSQSDHTLLAVSVEPTIVKLFDLVLEDPFQATELATIESPHRRPVTGLCLNAGATRLAALTSDQIIQVFDLAHLQRGLEKLRLNGRFAAFPMRTEKPPAVEVQPAEVDAESPRVWHMVEQISQVLDGETLLSPTKQATMHFDRGRAYQWLGDKARARRDFDQALRLNPDDAILAESIRRMDKAGPSAARKVPQ